MLRTLRYAGAGSYLLGFLSCLAICVECSPGPGSDPGEGLAVAI